MLGCKGLGSQPVSGSHPAMGAECLSQIQTVCGLIRILTHLFDSYYEN